VKKVVLVTDGACIGNPGRGGWAFVLRYRGSAKACWGSEPRTTNNRMELTAAIRGLQALKEPCEVEITTDSEYVMKGITLWIHGWKRKNWKNVKNIDLWQELDAENSRHRTRWLWTRGHASHADNNLCDELATAAARDQTADCRKIQ
jgi:ribonuclease HI